MSEQTEATKVVYQCDSAGWFCGDTVAHESPMDPGSYLIPAGCCEVEPPAGPYTEGLWPRWVGGEWVMQMVPTDAAKQVMSPVQKLAAFLAENHDVAAMIQTTNTGGV